MGHVGLLVIGNLVDLPTLLLELVITVKLEVIPSRENASLAVKYNQSMNQYYLPSEALAKQPRCFLSMLQLQGKETRSSSSDYVNFGCGFGHMHLFNALFPSRLCQFWMWF